MKILPKLLLGALVLPLAANAATKAFELPAFEAVHVAAGISADIRVGAAQSVVAEINSGDFNDLQVRVEGKVLKIGRPSRGWSWGGHRPEYRVHVVTPALRALDASSGADIKVTGKVAGDFSAEASSGGEIELAEVAGGAVKLEVSSSGEIKIAGSCTALDAQGSSGGEIEAMALKCATASVQASSGSDVSLAASSSVAGSASSGADVRVAGSPSVVKVSRSSGADLTLEH